MSLNLLNIFELFSCKTKGPVSIEVIEKLQEWNLISKNNSLKCNEGHILRLCPLDSAIDGFVRRCREKKTKRSSRCEFFQSIRKHIFFFNSHLSLFQIVSFSYLWLWLKNVSLSFIMEQISISENTAVDWAAFSAFRFWLYDYTSWEDWWVWKADFRK